MSLNSNLSQLATIERATRAVVAGGDYETTWSTVAEGVPCRIEVRRISNIIKPVGEVTVSIVYGIFPAGTDLRPRTGAHDTDRVTVEGNVYRVVGARNENDACLFAELEIIE